MPFRSLRFRAGRQLADRLIEELEHSGALSVTVEDAGDNPVFEVAQPGPPDWDEVWITGLFDAATDVAEVRTRLCDSCGGELECFASLVPDEDWERAWLRDFQPVHVGRRLWVCPSWLVPPDPHAVTVVIDPGLAFGTGTHITTRLCLEWLANARLSGKRIIDYGCGSGILAIAALKLGAARAWGVDVDPRALAASRTNALENNVAARYAAYLPQALPAAARGDVVIANILSGVILELADRLAALVAPEGHILLTGILEFQVEEVISRFAGRFQFERRSQDGWSLLIGRMWGRGSDVDVHAVRKL